MTFAERYAGDTGLLEFYKNKLLQPGWAGDLDPVELAYIKSQLKQSPSLKRRWGFKPSAKRLSENRIRAVAVDGLSENQKASFSFSHRKEKVKQVLSPLLRQKTFWHS